MNMEFLNTPDTTASYAEQDIKDNKMMALLSYIGLLWLIPIFAAKESAYAQYHVNQGIVLTIAGIVVGIASFVITLIPIVGWIVGPIVSLIPLAYMILGIINVCDGKAKELPFIGKYRILK